MRLEKGRFKIGEKVVVSIHGKEYSRKVFDDHGKPYIKIENGRAYENDISNNFKFDAVAYNNDYIRKHKDRLTFTAPKGMKDIWKKYAADQGMSLNAFVIYCVEKEIHG